MKNLFTTLLVLISFSLVAQEIGFGFKAGLNFNTIKGDSEMANGAELEDFTSNTGFHVGATFTWKATDLMGVRAELLYNQKGGRQSFEGPSYFTLTTTNGNTVATSGTRKQSLNLTTSYIDIPVVGYFRPVEQLQLYAGASVGFLVSASVFGEMNYTNGTTSTGAIVQDFVYEIDGNYLSDKPGEAFFDNPAKTVTIGNNSTAEIPGSAGVYYEYPKDLGNLYKAIDLGLVAGVSIFLNGSLYVSGRVNYGLSDITKQAVDVSLVSKSGTEFNTLDHDDRNFSIQTPIGFAF